jgi:hypothetical protein
MIEDNCTPPLRGTTMATTALDQIYEQQIKPLPRAARLQLLARIAQDLANSDETDESESSLLELEGLGAEIWQGIDAQQYVNEMRDEWDSPR